MNDSFYMWVARIGLLGLVAFALYYPWTFLAYNIPLHFSGPGSWQQIYIVDATAEVPLWWRSLYFCMWLPAVIATQVFILSAIRVTVLVLRGTYFEEATVRTLQWVGATAAVAGLGILAAGSFSGWMLTAYNAENRAPVRLFIESGEMGVLCAGLGLFLFAHVLKVTVLMDRENKEII